MTTGKIRLLVKLIDVEKHKEDLENDFTKPKLLSPALIIWQSNGDLVMWQKNVLNRTMQQG